MNASNDRIWNAAEFLIGWNSTTLVYKLLRVPRTAIDEDENEPDAHLLIGIDNGSVRRVDIMLDIAYGREVSDIEALKEAAKTAPQEAAEILNIYLPLANVVNAPLPVEHTGCASSAAAKR